MMLTVELAEYLLAVTKAWEQHALPESQKLDWCSECGDPIADMFAALGQHGVIFGQAGRDFIVLGCEGYWQVDPSAVGIEKPSWQSLEDQGIEVKRPAD